MHRRALLGGVAAGVVTTLAGCSGTPEDTGDNPRTDTSNGSDDGITQSEQTGDWSQFQADGANTGATTAVGPVGGGRVRWWSDTAGISTSPVIENGTVFVGSGFRHQSVFAFDRDTGDRVWQTEIGDSIDDIERTLAVDDGTVYASTDDVYALDAATGEKAWRERVDTVWGIALAEETVFAAAGGGGPIVALDETSGDTRWRRDLHTITAPSVAHDHVFVVGNDDLIALDAESGETEWTAPIDRAGGPPTVAEGTVAVGTREELFAHDVRTGDPQWTVEGSFRDTDIATSDGSIYLTGRQQQNEQWVSRALAVDAETGEIEWTTDDDGLRGGSAVVTEGTVYVTTSNRIYALDAETGDIEWWLRFQWPVSSPAVADGLLYVTVGGRLLAIESGESHAGVWQSDAEPIPDRDAAPGTPSYTGADFSFGTDGFDVRSDSELTVEEDAPIDVSFDIRGDRVTADDDVTITLAVTNEGDETLRTTTGPPRPFGVLTLRDGERRITPWTTAYEESNGVGTSAHRGVTFVNAVALSVPIPPGETVSETYTISDETHGIQPGSYELSLGQKLSPGEFGSDRDGWEFDVTGTVDLSAREGEDGDVVHDLAIADDVDLPEAFTGGFSVDVLEPVTDTHPGMIEVTFENVTGERSQFTRPTGLGSGFFGSYVGLGPDGRRLVLVPADTYAPGFVDRGEDGWWGTESLPHESVRRGQSTTSRDPDETDTQRFVVTAHPETDPPRHGDGYAFEQGLGDDNADVIWGFVLSALDPDRYSR